VAEFHVVHWGFSVHSHFSSRTLSLAWKFTVIPSQAVVMVFGFGLVISSVGKTVSVVIPQGLGVVEWLVTHVLNSSLDG
jgi:hypothetical protein